MPPRKRQIFSFDYWQSLGTIYSGVRMRIIFAFLLIAFGCDVLAQAPRAEISIAPSGPISKDRPEDTSSTLGPFPFQIEIRDPDVDFNRLNVFANPDNYGGGPRKQLVFVHVIDRDTARPVAFRLYQTGSGLGDGSKKIFFWVTVPFSDQERDSRISDAVKANMEKPDVKESLSRKGSPTLDQIEHTLKGLGLDEGKPGDYAVQVEYLSPSGKVASKPLQFAIRDRGSIYQLLLSGSYGRR